MDSWLHQIWIGSSKSTSERKKDNITDWSWWHLTFRVAPLSLPYNVTNCNPWWLISGFKKMEVCSCLAGLGIISDDLEHAQWLTLMWVDVGCKRRVKIYIFCSIFFLNLNFHCHICIQHEKCIQLSTNKPSIYSVVYEIAPTSLKKFCDFASYALKLLLACHALMTAGNVVWSGV